MDTNYLIDIAVLCQEYIPVEYSCNNTNITVLDEIEISKKDFLTLFYPHGENFGIDKTVGSNLKYNHYISFESIYRTVNGKKFFLLEQILQNLEADLNISRNCFTTSSRIELVNEFINIKSLCDMNCCSVVSSITWSNIEDIIRNNEKNNSMHNRHRRPIFVVSICFKTPTPNVKDNIIQFYYKII
jgi:hypothetical protein